MNKHSTATLLQSLNTKIGVAFVLIANVADGWSLSAGQDLDAR